VTRARDSEGGYISWVNPRNHELQQILWVDRGAAADEDARAGAAGMSLRFIREQTRRMR